MKKANLLNLDNPEDCQKLVGAIKNAIVEPDKNEHFKEELYFALKIPISRYLLDNKIIDERKERSKISGEIAEKILGGVSFETAMKYFLQKINPS